MARQKFRILTGDPNNLGYGSDVWQYLRDSFYNVFGRVQEWIEVGGTGGEPQFQNSWVNRGGSFETLAFYKDPYGRVHFKGAVDSGTNGTVAFTLPVGFRPLATLKFNGAYCTNILGAANSLQCLIAPNGNVTLNGGNSDGIALDCVSFRAEQ